MNAMRCSDTARTSTSAKGVASLGSTRGNPSTSASQASDNGRSLMLIVSRFSTVLISSRFTRVIRSTLVQLETPDEMRGRVSAVNATFISASNQLGEFRAGATATWLGPVGSVVLGGAGTLLVVALWIRLFPQLARRDKLVPERVT